MYILKKKKKKKNGKRISLYFHIRNYDGDLIQYWDIILPFITSKGSCTELNINLYSFVSLSLDKWSKESKGQNTFSSLPSISLFN